LVKPMMNAEPDQAAIDREASNWHRLASVLEKRVTDQAWICGDSVTLADIAVAAPMHLHSYQKLPLNTYPNIQRWMSERVEELPCWKATDVALTLGLKAA
jgi:glutathione S-transferase